MPNLVAASFCGKTNRVVISTKLGSCSPLARFLLEPPPEQLRLRLLLASLARTWKGDDLTGLPVATKCSLPPSVSFLNSSSCRLIAKDWFRYLLDTSITLSLVNDALPSNPTKATSCPTNVSSSSVREINLVGCLVCCLEFSQQLHRLKRASAMLLLAIWPLVQFLEVSHLQRPKFGQDI